MTLQIQATVHRRHGILVAIRAELRTEFRIVVVRRSYSGRRWGSGACSECGFVHFTSEHVNRVSILIVSVAVLSIVVIIVVVKLRSCCRG